MRAVLTSDQMRRIDRRTIEELGLPGAVLMESAGQAVCREILDRPGLSPARRPVVLCGKGNNGGDGFVVARRLQRHCEEGFPLVLLCGALGELSGDAALMARVALNCGVRVIELSGPDFPELEAILSRADLVVDALLGTGAAGAPRGSIGRVIEALAACSAPVVAVDCPSGVEMDSGLAPGAAVRAALTVTFGFEKPGHRFYPGRALCGEVVTADIGFPASSLDGLEPALQLSECSDLRRLIPPRRPSSHKGDYGKVLVLGGSTGLTGAVAMACRSALTVGAGMVTAGIPASLNPILAQKLTEAMTRPLPDGGSGALQPEALEQVTALLDEMDILALGPGLGRDEGTFRLLWNLAPRVTVPAVIDADGLNLLARDLTRLEQFRGPVVITPHPGEMSRLSGKTVAELAADPVEASRAFARQHGVVVLLKGAPSVVSDPRGRTVINPTGGPALAKAGSGDVLTGIIAGLMAQGMAAFEAAWCGAFLHGLAGDLAAQELGLHSVLARDLIGKLPRALAGVIAG